MMKILVICGVFLFGGLTALSAQGKRDVATMRIATSVECQMCQKRIENFFRREPGVEYVNVNYHNKVVTVRYMPSQIPASYILTDIANLGYDADTVKANPEFYAKLPDCCKKGGMAKLKEAQKLKRKH